MKKITKSLRKEYLPIVLHVENLEAIAASLPAKTSNIKIIANDYEYESVSELTHHLNGQHLSAIEIKFQNPWGTIQLTPYSTSLYVGDDDIHSSGVFFQLDKILKSCLRRPSFGYSYYTIWFLVIALPVINSLSENLTERIWFNVPYYLGYAWMAWVFFIRIKKHSIIILKRKTESPNFLKRNLDQIILLIIGAIIGSIFTTASQKFTFFNLSPSEQLQNQSSKTEKE